MEGEHPANISMILTLFGCRGISHTLLIHVLYSRVYAWGGREEWWDSNLGAEGQVTERSKLTLTTKYQVGVTPHHIYTKLSIYNVDTYNYMLDKAIRSNRCGRG